MEDEVVDSTVEEIASPEVEAPAAEKTMDDTIRETLAEIESRGETEEQKAERLRDERGRFAAKTDDPPAGSPAATPEQAPQAAPAQAPAVPPELQRLGLRKDEAEAFMHAPEAVRNAFLRRSEEMHKGLEQYRSKAEFGHAMEQVITPYASTIQALGMHPASAVQNLLAADHSLRYGNAAQKQQLFLKLAEQYGVDLGQVQQTQAEQPYVDPQVQTMQQQLQQLQGWILQRNQQEQQREQAALHSEIERFAADPANKHFQSVKQDMAALLQAGVAKDLKDAYERAIYANPTTRAQLQAEQQAEQQRKAEAERQAQAAKRAAAVNTPRRGALPASRPIGTMDDTIRETAKRLGML